MPKHFGIKNLSHVINPFGTPRPELFPAPFSAEPVRGWHGWVASNYKTLVPLWQLLRLPAFLPEDGTRKILPKDVWRQSAMATKKHESVGSNKQLNVRVRVTI